MTIALWAGGPGRFFDQDASGGAGAQKSASSSQGSDAGGDQFRTGYGKGIEKGIRQGQDELLSALGVGDVEAAKAMIARAKQADEDAKKAAEQQGQFKSLYEQEKAAREKAAADAAALKARVDSFEAMQKAELETVTAKFTDDQKKLLDGLPLDKQLQVAKALGGTAQAAAVGAPAGKGTPPNGDGAKTLEAYQRKGWPNLTPEERVHAKSLMAQAESMSVEDYAKKFRGA